MTAPAISVVIPHYNDLQRLETCLTALAPQLADQGAAAEAVVADNASPVDLAALAARFPAIRIVTEPRRGAAAARNRGVAETTAPHIAFLDSDCVPAADWLATARRLAAAEPGTLWGGQVRTFDETPPPRSGAEVFEAVFAFNQRRYIAEKGFSVTANLVVPRAVWDGVGEMVPGLAEDVEWCTRATAAGHPLRYADALSVGHPTRSDWPALRKKWRRTTDEMFLTHGTAPARRLSWALRAGAVLASGPVHAPRIVRTAGLSAGERARGVATLLRLRTTRCGWMLAQAVRGAPQPAGPAAAPAKLDGGAS